MLDKIKNAYKEHKPKPMMPFKESAVMLLLSKDEKGYLQLVLEVRALTLRSQPGDICLPGGRMDQGETSKETALRETIEELGINIADMEYIGAMDYMVNPYGIKIYPHIAFYHGAEYRPNKDEVDHLFYVPLAFFIEQEPEGYDLQVGPLNLDDFPTERIRGGKKYPFRKGQNIKYFYQYGDYTIWGFTAEIIKYFIESLK